MSVVTATSPTRALVLRDRDTAGHADHEPKRVLDLDPGRGAGLRRRVSRPNRGAGRPALRPHPGRGAASWPLVGVPPDSRPDQPPTFGKEG
jgi:hypothetical protein